MNGPGGSRVPRLVTAGIAGLEAAGALTFVGVLVHAASRGGATDATGALILAVVAFVVAVGLLFLGRALAGGRRWPIGLFVTIQVLVVVVTLGQVGAIMRQGSAVVTGLGVVLVLACAAAGLWAAIRLRALPPPQAPPPHPQPPRPRSRPLPGPGGRGRG